MPEDLITKSDVISIISQILHGLTNYTFQFKRHCQDKTESAHTHQSLITRLSVRITPKKTSVHTDCSLEHEEKKLGQ